MSSTCTGVFTAEICAYLIEKTVHCSACGLYVNIKSERCHDPCPQFRCSTNLFHNCFENISLYFIEALILTYWPDYMLKSFSRHEWILTSWSSLMAKELNHRARQVIFDHCKWVNEWVGSYKPVPHVFSDLKEMVPTGSFQEHDNFAKRVMDVETAGLKSTQFCHTHGGECPINKPVDVDMSGLPCEDNSTAGKRMYLHGRFGSCYLVWAKFHREMATPVLVLENTPAFWLY